MKKILSVLLILATLVCFASCGEEENYPVGTKFYKSLTVVTDTVQTYAIESFYNDQDQLVREVIKGYADEKVTDTVISVSDYTYNAAGLVIKSNTENFGTGVVTELTMDYDSHGNITERLLKTTENGVTTESGYTAEYTYDSYDRVLTISTTEIGGETVSATYTYVSADKKDCMITYSNGNVGRQIYDKNGDLFVQVDMEGVTTKYRYVYTKTDYDKDGSFERTLTERTVYDEWENIVTKTSIAYDKYGNVVVDNTYDGENKVVVKYSYSYVVDKPVVAAE